MKFDIDDGTERQTKKKESGNQTLFLIIAGFLVLAAIILIVTYMALKSGNNNKTTPQVPVTTPTASTPVSQPLTIFDEESNERPIAVMIDNAIGDAKHAGLQESYLNYEIIVEGGITRIMAIYKDRDVNLIGPIRSSRHYFLDYALESDAIYVHYGWSPYAADDVTKLQIDNINGLTDPTPFRRDTNSVAPHNVFTRMSYLKTFLESTNYNQESSDWLLFDYSSDPVDLTDTNYVPKTATKVNIPYSSVEYRTYAYDESHGYYLRSSNGKPQYDRKSGVQLHYKNIIIQRVPNKTMDIEGRQQLETTGTGTAYYITNGYFLPIKWSKSSRDAKTSYTYEDGTEITLNDGNTFIQIVPTDCNVTID